jgi:hypothetical protein
MTCINPRLAYKKTNGQFTLAKIGDTAPIASSTLVPCGQCMQCRISHQRQWATRMVHEAKMHSEPSCFLTLTIDDEHRTESRSVDQRDMQLFIKKLRKHLAPRKIRIFYCSEYGETTQREHYHAILFGYMPEDKKDFKKNKQGDMLYTSETLTNKWQKGFVTIGEFNATTAEYCAKYVTKAYIGADKENAYNWTDSDGVVHKRTPPFQRASNRPGLGATFYEKYKADMYPHDACIIDGKPRPVPKAYDRKYKKDHPEEYLALKARRNDKFTTNLNNDPHQKTKSFRNAQAEILKQNLNLKKRDQT